MELKQILCLSFACLRFILKQISNMFYDESKLSSSMCALRLLKIAGESHSLDPKIILCFIQF